MLECILNKVTFDIYTSLNTFFLVYSFSFSYEGFHDESCKKNSDWSVFLLFLSPLFHVLISCWGVVLYDSNALAFFCLLDAIRTYLHAFIDFIPDDLQTSFPMSIFDDYGLFYFLSCFVFCLNFFYSFLFGVLHLKKSAWVLRFFQNSSFSIFFPSDACS